ncbi:MAG: hypothetical protein WKF34_02245 [Pyrinomonadaceae bacterium]
MIPIRLISFIITFSAFGAAYGQSPSETPAAVSPPAVEIMNQPGSPVRLELLGSDSFPLSPPNKPRSSLRTTIRVRVDNVGEQAVGGYAIVFQSEKFTNVSAMALGKLLEKGQTNTFPTSSSAEWDSPVWASVDYVQFEDGTSWGADRFKRSVQIGRFLDGRNLAIARLEEILINHPDAEFHRRQVKGFIGQAISGMGPESNAVMLQTAFDFGYESVLKGLRAPSKKVADGQEIARKLELAQIVRP